MICIASLHGKTCPRYLVQDHHIIGLTHTQFFVEAVGIFIKASEIRCIHRR